MRRSFEARGFTLIEMLVAVGIGGIVVALTVWAFTNFKQSSDQLDAWTQTRADTLQAGATVQALLGRRNSSLDRNPATPSVSYRLGTTPELTVVVRQGATTSKNATYTLTNECSPRPASGYTSPPAPLSRCKPVCSGSQVGSVVLKTQKAGKTQSRLLVGAAEAARPGRVATAGFCLTSPATGSGPPEALLEIVSQAYGAAPGAPYREFVAIENLALSLRDPQVELTGRE